MGLKYEVSNSDSKTIKIVRELNINFGDKTVFDLPKDGKANEIIVR